MMTRGKRMITVFAIGATLAVGSAAPALADRGGVPNDRSCGGIGKEKGDEGAFMCDDVQSNASPKASNPGQGFPRPRPRTTHTRLQPGRRPGMMPGCWR